MKKRILSMLLAVVMLIGLMPVFEIPAQAAYSEDAVVNPVAPEHEDNFDCSFGYTPCYSFNSGLENVKLMENIETNQTWTIAKGKTVNLCLHGKTWTYTGDGYAFVVQGGGTLNIFDCKTTEKAGYVDGVDHRWHPGTPDSEDDTAVTLPSSGVMTCTNVNGGLFDIECGVDTTTWTGIPGVVNFYSGNIAGSYLNGGSKGLIYACNSVFNMMGGTITGNGRGPTDDYGSSTLINVDYASGIYYESYQAQFNMFGGKIQHNRYVSKDTNNGLLWIEGIGTFKGGEVSNNNVLGKNDELVQCAGVVFAYTGGTLQLWGTPRITNNKGYAIFTHESFYVSGAPYVYGNTDGNSNPTDIGLPNGDYMVAGAYCVGGHARSPIQPAQNVSYDLTEGTALGVTLLGDISMGGDTLPDSATLLYHSSEGDYEYVTCHNMGYEKKHEPGNPAITTRVYVEKIKPTVFITTIDGEIEFGKADDTAKYQVDLFNYKEADLENVSVNTGYWYDLTNNNNSNVTFGYIGYEAYYEKVSDTRYIITIRQDEEHTNPAGVGTYNQLTFYENLSISDPDTKRATFTLTVTKGNFTPPTLDAVTIRAGKSWGPDYVWTAPTDLPVGISVTAVNYPEDAAIRTDDNEDGTFTFNAYQAVEGTTPAYYDLEVVYEQKNSNYVTVGTGKQVGTGTLRVYFQFPGIMGTVDESTRPVDPETSAPADYDAVFGGGVESTTYNIEYLDVDLEPTKPTAHWTDADGNLLEEGNFPAGLALELTDPDLVDKKATLTVSSTADVAVGTYYFVVMNYDWVTPDKKSNVMSYVVEKAEFDGESTARIEMTNGSETEDEVTIDLSATSGGVFGTPVKSDPEDTYFDSTWFDVVYDETGKATIKITAKLPDSTTEIPSTAKTGKIEIPVTGCPNYQDYTYVVFVEPIFKSVSISNPAAVTYGSSSTTEGSVEYIVLSGTNATFEWVTDETGETVTTAPTGFTGGFAEGDTSKLTFTYDGTVDAGNTYYYKVTVEDGGTSYSDIGSISVGKANPPSAKIILEAQLLYLEGSQLVIDLAAAGHIVDGGWSQVVGNYLDHCSYKVENNVVTITNQAQTDPDQATKELQLQVQSTNYNSYRIHIKVSPLFKNVTLGEQSGTPTYGAAGDATFTVNNTELKGETLVFEWVGVSDEDKATLSYEFDSTTVAENGNTLTISTSAATPAGNYTFKVSVTDDGTTYSKEGTVNIKKAQKNVNSEMAGEVLFLADSYTEFDLTDAIVDGGELQTTYHEGYKYYWQSYMVPGTKTLRVTNTILRDEEIPALLVKIPVTSNNYEDYEIVVTITVLFKQVNVGTQSGTLTYGTGSSATFFVDNTELAGSKATINWFEADGVTPAAAPSGVSVMLGDVEIDATADANSPVFTAGTNANPVGYGDTLTVTTAAGTPAGTYCFTITSTEENGDTYTSDVTTLTVNKREITVPTKDVDNEFTYNSEEQTYIPVNTDDSAADWYVVSDNKATNAGSYTAKITLKDTENTVWDNGTTGITQNTSVLEYNFTIERKAVVMKPKALYADDTNAMPNKFVFELLNVIPGDDVSFAENAAPTVTIRHKDGSAILNARGEVVVGLDNIWETVRYTPGTYQICWDDYNNAGNYFALVGEHAANYEISGAQVGTLTIVTCVTTGGAGGAGGSTGGSTGDADDKACLKDVNCPIYPFVDTDMNLWYHDGVHYCIENGLMSGISTTQFAPNMVTNRAMRNQKACSFLRSTCAAFSTWQES